MAFRWWWLTFPDKAFSRGHRSTTGVSWVCLWLKERPLELMKTKFTQIPANCARNSAGFVCIHETKTGLSASREDTNSLCCCPLWSVRKFTIIYQYFVWQLIYQWDLIYLKLRRLKLEFLKFSWKLLWRLAHSACRIIQMIVFWMLVANACALYWLGIFMNEYEITLEYLSSCILIDR